MENALLIFVKNLQPGKVKTRLAATLGDDRAYQIYEYLLDQTYRAVQDVRARKYVCYSDFLEPEARHGYQTLVQSGTDLGERMLNAFQEMFARGAIKTIVIGSDNPDVNSDLINNAFEVLDSVDIVIGPATDGGYYLLGMKVLHPELFHSIPWSTAVVYETTVCRIQESGLNYQSLRELRDIDEEQDWHAYERRMNHD